MNSQGANGGVIVESPVVSSLSAAAPVPRHVQLTKSEESPQKPSKHKCRMELNEITHHNVKQLRIINQTVFPISYNDKFYKDVLEAGELARLAYFNDMVVGAVCCRVDHFDGGFRKLYILTLACLAPYRRMGVGTMMLHHVLQLAQRDPTLHSVYLHVQVNNEGAIDFYKRHGFTVVETKTNYYRRIEPADAYLLEKVIVREPPAPSQ